MNVDSALVEPAHSWLPEYHQTFGGDVAELASIAGFAPDPEQRVALDAIFAVDRYGKSVAFETAVICCRQNMKTGLFKQVALGWLFVTDERLVVWSAHEFRTAQEAFRDLDELVTGTDALRRRVKAIYRGNGDESIELDTGTRLIFKTRTKGGGRGLSGDKVILDEAFALQPMHMGALLPTLSARPDPQVLYGSSAALVDSAVLRALRDRGRAGGEPRLAYLEWCSAPPEEVCELGTACTHALGTEGCGCDDPANWQRANPAMGRRITQDYIAAERRALPPEEFARERMGWHDDPLGAETVISLGTWRDLKDSSSKLTDPVVFAVDATPDRAFVSVAVAGKRDDGKKHLEVVDHLRGTHGVAARLVQLRDRWDPIAVVIDPGSPAGSLIPEVEAAGVEVLKPTARESAAGCGLLVDAIATDDVRHLGDDLLEAAVEGAAKRDLGEGLWRWTRTGTIADISPLVAGTLALWGYLLKAAEFEDYDVLESVW